MKVSQLKFKIVSLLIGIGLMFILIFAFYAPYQAKQLGNSILKKDSEFTANLIIKNLRLSLESIKLGNGAALEQSLNLIKDCTDNGKSTITEISVFNEQMEFLNGLNTDSNEIAQFESVEKLVFEDRDDTLKVLSPIYDSENKILGYVNIDFSKHFLNKGIDSNNKFALIIGFTAFIAIIMIGYYFVLRLLDIPINKLVKGLKNVASKRDLTQKVEIDSRDEIGELSNSFNEMIQLLNKTLSRIFEKANQINDSVTNMSTSVGEQAEIILQQDESVNNTTSAMEELSVTAKQIAESAEEVSNQIEMAARKVSIFSEKANQIGKVISTIEYITEKIDNLSLNASIEAARAGEQGKSFAVVASEIRKLAENTSKSTEDIITLIEDIQNSTADAVLSTEQAVDFVKRIKLSIQQHNIGTQQADEAMIVINDGMKKTSNGISIIVEAIEGINESVIEMKEFASKFKINNDVQ